ncbi:MAG: 2-phospho-L-lactate guanylyltransferase [Actinobacteria bacterium]|nr:2-phospho-L-lactate guanylyltransferase [Actinomycetota bacterium]
MRALIVIPAKPLARAKARLATFLDGEERQALALAMLRDVVSAATQVAPVWVVCSDEEAVAVARERGAEAVPDKTPEAGLNASLSATTADVTGAGYDGALVLASDLPCVRPEDVAALLGPAQAVIAPSAGGDGTNALWRSPADLFPTAFGEKSRSAHERLAAESGLAALIVRRPRLELDVDDPGDLTRAVELGTGPATAAIVRSVEARR